MPPIKPYLAWEANLGNPAWPRLAVAAGSTQAIRRHLAACAPLDPERLEDSALCALISPGLLELAARSLCLSDNVLALIDSDKPPINQMFQLLLTVRTCVREGLPTGVPVTVCLAWLNTLSLVDRATCGCLARAMAESDPLVLYMDAVDQTSPDVQQRLMSLIEVLRQWVVLDNLPVGILLGQGGPVRHLGLRRLLKAGVCPDHGR